MLPAGPTSYRDSPYQGFSAYAGNPYFVDLDLPREDGLLRLAARRGWERDAEQVSAFARENKDWLPDYTLFMALKRRCGMKVWQEWPDGDVRLLTYIQYQFFRQWTALRAYAGEKGVGVIGDLPIYVAMDSADVWAEPGYFQLDAEGVPDRVAARPACTISCASATSGAWAPAPG